MTVFKLPFQPITFIPFYTPFSSPLYSQYFLPISSPSHQGATPFHPFQFQYFLSWNSNYWCHGIPVNAFILTPTISTLNFVPTHFARIPSSWFLVPHREVFYSVFITLLSQFSFFKLPQILFSPLFNTLAPSLKLPNTKSQKESLKYLNFNHFSYSALKISIT